MRPKGISVLIGFVLVVAISITGVAIVLTFGQSIINQQQDSGTISEATQNMQTLDSMIQQVATEGPGSILSTQLRSSGGTYRVNSVSGDLEFSYQLNSNIFPSGFFKKQGTLTTSVITNGASATQNSTNLILDNGILQVVLQNVMSSLNSGLVGWWKLDEGSGTTTADSSGNGNTGTLMNSPTWQNGANCKFGNCLNFSPSNSYVKGTTVTNLPTGSTPTFTVSLWFYRTNSSNFDSLFWEGALVSNTCTNNISLFLRGGQTQLSTDTNCANNFGPSISLNSWHQAVITMTSSGTEIVYVDGGSSTQICTNCGITMTAAAWSIGSNNNFGYFAPDVSIDDVRVYNRTLSASEVQNLYTTEAPLINTSTLIQSITFKNTGVTVNPNDTSIIIGNITNSSWGTGYTQLAAPGTFLTQAQATAFIQSAATGNNYKIIYTLPSAADFLEVFVTNVSSTNQTTINYAYHLGTNGLFNDTIRINGSEMNAGNVTPFCYTNPSEIYTCSYDSSDYSPSVVSALIPTSSFNQICNDNLITSDTIGLIGWWKLDEGSGTTTTDSSGNGNTGTLMNSPTWQSGANCKFGNCLNFNSSKSQYVGLPSNGLGTNGLGALSASAWFYTQNSAVSQQNTFAIYSGFSNGALSLGTSNGHTYVDFFLNGTDYAEGSLGTVTNNTWHYMVVTWNNTNPYYTVYLDGSSVGTRTGLPTGVTISSATALGLVGALQTNGFFWTGQIDDIRIYNRALPQTEIQQLYNNYIFNVTSIGSLSVIIPFTQGTCAVTIGNKTTIIQNQGIPSTPFASVNVQGQKTFDLLLSYNKIELQGNLRIGTGTFQVCVQKVGTVDNIAIVNVTEC